MNVKELKRLIEAQGYEVKSIKTFKNSFHVNVWTPTLKLRFFYKRPLEQVTWEQLKRDYPKI